MKERDILVRCVEILEGMVISCRHKRVNFATNVMSKCACTETDP